MDLLNGLHLTRSRGRPSVERLFGMAVQHRNGAKLKEAKLKRPKNANPPAKTEESLLSRDSGTRSPQHGHAEF